MEPELPDEGPDVAGGLEALDAGRGADGATRLVHRWMADERGARRVLARFRTARAAEVGVWRTILSAPLANARAWSAMALAAVLLVGAFAWHARATRGGPPAFAVTAAPGARWSATGADGKPAAGLAAGGALAVESGEAALALAEKLTARARAGTRLSAQRIDAGQDGAPRTVELKQDAGSLVYELAPHAGWQVSIATPSCTVRVTGTRFRVAVEGQSTTVAVGRGTVQVSAGDSSRAVGESHQVVCTPGAAVPEPGAFNMIIDEDFAEGGEARIGVSR